MDRNAYETPREFFLGATIELGCTWDLAAVEGTTKCKKFFSPKEDSLSQDWHKLNGWLWLNPPYKPLRPWMEKVQLEASKGAHIICLVPAPTICNTYMGKYPPSKVAMIEGRISFLMDGKPVHGNRDNSSLLYYSGRRNSSVIPMIRVRRDAICDIGRRMLK